MDAFHYLRLFIERNDKFIITAHETPDGDALGAETALYQALKKLGKGVEICNADPTSKKYKFLDPDEHINIVRREDDISLPLEEYALIILDTSDIHNIGLVYDFIFPNIKEYFIVDHHESLENRVTKNHVEESASSTCEILYDFFFEQGWEIDFTVAQALFVGIVYDTGSFIYPKTSAKTFSIAYSLVSIGVNPNYIYQRIYESNSISALMLQSRVLSTLELFFNQHVALVTMTKETIAECGALYEEADTIINIPLKSEPIRVSVFLKENEKGVLRCSMRSKGNIDVARIAQTFGGGGHKTAAGFKSKWPIETLKQKVLEMLSTYTKEMEEFLE
ncbi:MAG: bifunctional oligoribonuclease/PAP phosphatase NrnA [Spirochaetia bacterium]